MLFSVYFLVNLVGKGTLYGLITFQADYLRNYMVCSLVLALFILCFYVLIKKNSIKKKKIFFNYFGDLNSQILKQTHVPPNLRSYSITNKKKKSSKMKLGGSGRCTVQGDGRVRVVKCLPNHQLCLPLYRSFCFFFFKNFTGAFCNFNIVYI